MKESFPTPEAKKEVSREEALNAFKKFVEQGVTDFSDLDSEDPEVKKAEELFYEWQRQIDEKSKGNKEAEIRAELLKTMFYVDAGFSDSMYLDDVLNDFLVQTSVDTPKEENNPEREETRRQIADAMLKIKGILGAEKSKSDE